LTENGWQNTQQKQTKFARKSVLAKLGNPSQKDEFGNLDVNLRRYQLLSTPAIKHHIGFKGKKSAGV
jgi:hypothetical protein